MRGGIGHTFKILLYLGTVSSHVFHSGILVLLVRKGLRTKERAEIINERGPGTHPHRKSFSSPGQRYMLQVTLALTNSTT